MPPPATVSMAMTSILPSQISKLCLFPLSSNNASNSRTDHSAAIKFSYIHKPHLSQRRFFVTPIAARGSARQKKRGASNAEPKVNPMSFKDAKVVLESREDDKIQLRVDLNGVDTQKVFSKVLRDLNRTAPPVPGFRLQKGGKMSEVPQEFLVQMLGEDRVMGFVIQEIITSTTADYVEKENLKVKENKINTTQKEDELKKIFKPGDEFGFNVVLELEEPEPESESEPEPESKSEPETETSD